MLEYDQGTDRNFFARVEIVTVRALCETDSTCGTCVYPSCCCIVIGTGRTRVGRLRNTAGINTRDIRQIVIVHIRYITGAAKTAALESGNIRSETGSRTGFCYGFSTVLHKAIRDVRAVGRCSGTICFINGSIILLRLYLITGIRKRIQIDVVQHLIRDVRCRSREYCRRNHRDDHQHRQEKGQKTRAKFVSLGHNFQSFLIFDMKRAPTLSHRGFDSK